MSEIDELILASRALAHAASQAISLEQVPSRIVHEFYQAVRTQQEAAKAHVPAALDRASIPVMFNVLADEIRKLGAIFDNPLKVVWDGEARDAMDRAFTENKLMFEQMARIEAQLTALRAEADKGTRLTEIEARLNVNSNDAALVSAELGDLCAQLVRFEKLVSDKLALSPAARKKKQERKRGKR